MLVPIGGGVSLDVADAGRGSAVVLLHGWPVTAAHWRYLVPVLNRAGYRTLAVEARGLGSTSTGRGDFTKARLAAEVGRALDALGVRRMALVGHDQGGTVAALLAAQQPGRVVALVMEEELPPGLGLTVPPGGREHYPAWHGPLFRAPNGLAEELLGGRFELVVDGFLTASAGPPGIEFDARLAYLDAHRGDDRLAASLALYRAEREDASALRAAARRRLRMPGLAIGGRYAFGEAVVEGLARLVTGARGLLTPAGHYPAEQAPDQVASAVLQFLRSV